MSPRRRAFLFAVVLVPALVVALLVARSRGPGVRQDQAGPVLLVPGYGGGTSQLLRLAERLRAAGRQADIVPAPDGGTADLAVHADRLRDAADARIAAGAPSVDVIGFSAGGVVVRLWAAERDGARQARRIVTLGSPHHGTDVAGLASEFAPERCPTACRQLAPGSQLLTGLPDTVEGPAWTSVWTTVDDVVRPPDSARLQGAVNIPLQSVCADARTPHGSLPGDPLVAGIVKIALGSEPLREPPGPAQCADLRAAGR